jgi:hypothetical protein
LPITAEKNRYCQSPVLLLSSCMPDPTPRLTSVTTTIRRRSITKRTQLVRGRSVPAIPFIRIALDTRFRIIRSQRLEGGQHRSSACQPSYVRESKAGICLLEAETHGPICALYQILVMFVFLRPPVRSGPGQTGFAQHTYG